MIENLRPEFQISLLIHHSETRRMVRQALAEAGYQVEGFVSGEELLKEIPVRPPHIIVIDGRADDDIRGLVEQIARMSEDIQVVLLNQGLERWEVRKMFAAGVFDEIGDLSPDGWEALARVDQIVEKIYLKYQNEQVWSRFRDKDEELRRRIAKDSKISEHLRLTGVLEPLLAAESIEVALAAALKGVSQICGASPTVYLRYVPVRRHLYAALSSGIEKENLQSWGITFDEMEGDSAEKALEVPETCEQLGQFVKEVFGSEKFCGIPLMLSGRLHGLLLILDEDWSEPEKGLIQTTIQMLQSRCESLMAQKSLLELKDRDALTGLLDKKAFLEKLDFEISRARRLGHPLGLVHLSIDDFKFYSERNGQTLSESTLKMVSSMLLRTSRKSDWLCYAGQGEFLALLPHTSAEGSAIKAEKFRRMIELTSFPMGDRQPRGNLTASLGISEYPSLSTDAESLVRTAFEALDEVQRNTCNRTCLATPSEDFQPDYIPEKVADHAKLRSLEK